MYMYMCIYIYIYIYKADPLQTWSDPEGSRKLNFPDFVTTAQDGGKVVSLKHRLYEGEKIKRVVKLRIFRDATQCGSVDMYWHVEGIFCPLLQGRIAAYLSADYRHHVIQTTSVPLSENVLLHSTWQVCYVTLECTNPARRKSRLNDFCIRRQSDIQRLSFFYVCASAVLPVADYITVCSWLHFYSF